MPLKRAKERARKDKRAGKSVATQAGEFVREEVGGLRRRKHAAKNRKQAIAIGLAEARRAGVKVPPKPRAKKVASRRSRAR